MEIEIDTQTITEAGFDKYLTRVIIPEGVSSVSIQSRTLDPNSFVGGIIGGEGILYLGSKQVRIDGANKRIVINDGTTDRVIIGYLG